MDRNRQKLVGKVVSDSMDKTIVVSVERLVKHRLYKKYIRPVSYTHLTLPTTLRV